MPEAGDRVYGTGVFLWVLQNFYKHLFCRAPPDDCFCIAISFEGLA